jgi:ATP-dependent RNA helicase DDX35
MQRCNPAAIILQLKAFGIENIFKFNLMTTPPKQNIQFALELLYSLGALDDYARLMEPLGLQLAEFPVEPQMAAMLVKSVEFKCTAEILSIAAMLLVENVFITNSRIAENRRRFAVEEGDHISHLNVYCLFHKNNQSQKWCQKNGINYKAMLRATSIRAQLEKYLRRYGLSTEQSSERNVEPICRCIVASYFSQAAHAREVGIGVGAEESGTYETLRGKISGLNIHPSSIFFKSRVPQWIIYHEVVETTKIFIRDILSVEPEWLLELAPHYYESKAVKKSIY